MSAPSLFPSSLALMLLSAAAVSASNVVVSNLAASGALMTGSSGDPLAAGSMIRLGSFPGLDAAEISTLAEQGPDALLAALSGFGPAFQVGTGAGNAAGRVEITANQAVADGGPELHAVVLNAPTAGAATEVLVLRLADSVPADDLSGLPGYLAVHLRDAELVYGTHDGTGYATRAAAVAGETFDAWILGQLGEDSTPADRTAEADADGDGTANLLEYALGSLPGDAASRPRIEIRESNDEYFVLTLRRTSDPSITIACETEADLSAAVWPLLETPLEDVIDPPAPAPEGHRWVQQKLPPGSRAFVRVKVTSSEAP